MFEFVGGLGNGLLLETTIDTSNSVGSNVDAVGFPDPCYNPPFIGLIAWGSDEQCPGSNLPGSWKHFFDLFVACVLDCAPAPHDAIVSN